MVINYGEGGGGYKLLEGGASEVLPLQKGGGGAAGKVFAILEVGPSMVVLIWVLEVLTILERGGAQKVSTLSKGGGRTNFTLS